MAYRNVYKPFFIPSEQENHAVRNRHLPETNDKPLQQIDLPSFKIQIMHVNIRSVKNKVDSINVLLAALNYPEVMFFSETWLRNDYVIDFVLDNYVTAAYYCRSESRGGGVAIFVRSDIKFVNNS